MPNLGFLHTAQVHVDTFETLARDKALSTEHRVHTKWLQQATSKRLDGPLRTEITRELKSLRRVCDVVICTCSTLGELARQFEDTAVFRVDAPMMEQAAATAIKSGTETVTLLAYCLESTRAASTQLLEDAFRAQNQTPKILQVNCETAWPHFEAGDNQRFGEEIAAHITAAAAGASKQVCSVVLAQASMTAAESYLGNDLRRKVLSSPASAINHAQTLLNSGMQPDS